MTLIQEKQALSQGTGEKRTIVQALNNALIELMAEDPSVLILGEDVGINGGVFRVTDQLYQKFGEERVMDTPLAESGIVGMSVGLAIGGFRPVAEIQFMGFIYPAINQLFSHVARMRNRTRGNITLPLVLRMPYGGGIHAPEHHSESYEAILTQTPGLTVVIPSTPSDAKGLLVSSIRSNDPVVFLEPKQIYRAFKENVADGLYEVPLGEAKVVQEGNDVTLVSYGAMMRPTLEAAKECAKTNISCEVIDLRTIQPFDKDRVINSVKKTGRLVVVHEAPRLCGIGAELTALVNDYALLHLLAPVERVTGFDTVFPYAKLEHYYLPNKNRILEAINRTIHF